MTPTPRIKIYVMEDGRLPTSAHDTDAGLDLYAAESIIIPSDGTPKAWRTGIKMEMTPDWYAEITGRSSMGLRGIGTMTGTIDPGYRGELKVVLYSTDGKEHRISRGDKIAQMIFHERHVPRIDRIDSEAQFTESERGDGGFGSSGR